MARKDVVRGLVLAAVCLGVLAYDWRFLAWPMHRTMALLVMAAVFSFAWFYELTMRDAPMGRVLAGVLTIIGGAAVLWLVLTLFIHPLPDDSTPLVPAGEALTAGSCQMPSGALTVAVGAERVISRSRRGFTPFQAGGCPGPSFTVTPHGLVVDDFGYDGDGSVIFRIRHNLFDLIQGDYLHLHRPDVSTLGVYDEWENEIFLVRYLGRDAVRLRGRFLCGDHPTVSVDNDSVKVGSVHFSRPSCLLDRQRRY